MPLLASQADWTEACEEWDRTTHSDSLTLPTLLVCQTGCTHKSSWVCNAHPSPEHNPVCLCLCHED
jgi:hypothetical protein